MNINPGEFKKRIKIIELVETKDNDGYATVTRVVKVERWAKVSRTSGTEAMKSNADFSDISIRFLFRYTTGIDRKMIVEYDGNDYEIEYINDYEDSHKYIEILGSRVAL